MFFCFVLKEGMLPLHLGDEDTHVGARMCREARTRVRRAWKNVTHLREMDLEGTAWLMVHLCISPTKVYRSTAWHRRESSCPCLLVSSFSHAHTNTCQHRNERTLGTRRPCVLCHPNTAAACGECCVGHWVCAERRGCTLGTRARHSRRLPWGRRALCHNRLGCRTRPLGPRHC